MAKLKLSTDQKVTNAVTASGGVAVKNAFGLPAGRTGSCVDATPFCSKVCYAGRASGSERYSGVKNLVWHNFELLKAADRDDKVRLLDEMIEDFIKASNRRGAPLFFRIHWDGDFFSPEYVVAWATVIRRYSEVQFWAYTRVGSAALFLHAQRLPNLGLYFSADRDNMETARAVAAKGVKIAYVGESFEEGKELFPAAVRCPQNNGSIPLIDANGSACAKCRLCVNGRRDVLFKLH